MAIDKYDIVLIGTGIVGASTAFQLKDKFPHLSVLLLDKENRPAVHQTGHNSGVVHAGVYYQPGSLKADFCKRGAQLTKDFCLEYNLPFEQCGKLLVATNEVELNRMAALAQRCEKNNIKVQHLSSEELENKEPNITGAGALFVGDTAITDYQRITGEMVRKFSESGGTVLYDTKVQTIKEGQGSVLIQAGERSIETSYLIACGGLMADRLVHMMGIELDFQIIPFRGEYYQLVPEFNNIVNHLIYPIPDPELPFLGIHLTRMIDGSVTVGPNAVIGWKREGYGDLNFSGSDVIEMIRFPGFWKVLRENLSTGLEEMKDSLFKSGYLKRVQKYCPSLSNTDLRPYPAGIRAQAVMADGSLVHDFLFAESPRSFHVCNAPSPAATSAIPIGEYLVSMAEAKFQL